MKNIAPDIFRQRLLIEGYYTINVAKNDVEDFLVQLPEYLGLRVYSKPIVFSPSTGMGKEEIKGLMDLCP